MTLGQKDLVSAEMQGDNQHAKKNRRAATAQLTGGDQHLLAPATGAFDNAVIGAEPEPAVTGRNAGQKPERRDLP